MVQKKTQTNSKDQKKAQPVLCNRRKMIVQNLHSLTSNHKHKPAVIVVVWPGLVLLLIRAGFST